MVFSVDEINNSPGKTGSGVNPGGTACIGQAYTEVGGWTGDGPGSLKSPQTLLLFPWGSN